MGNYWLRQIEKDTWRAEAEERRHRTLELAGLIRPKKYEGTNILFSSVSSLPGQENQISLYAAAKQYNRNIYLGKNLWGWM